VLRVHSGYCQDGSEVHQLTDGCGTGDKVGCQDGTAFDEPSQTDGCAAALSNLETSHDHFGHAVSHL